MTVRLMEGLDAGPLRLAQRALNCSAAWLKLGPNRAVIRMPAVCTSETGESKLSALILRFAMPRPQGALLRPSGEDLLSLCVVLPASASVVRGPPQDGPPAPAMAEGLHSLWRVRAYLRQAPSEPHRLRLWLPTPRDGKEHAELQPAAVYWRRLIGIGRNLTAPPSHTTVHTGHVHGGSLR